MSCTGWRAGISITSAIINKGYRITVNGLVQGVGFRPFIYQLAREHHLKGEVYNTINGVTIQVEGTPEILDLFISDIQNKRPIASCIKTLTLAEMPLNGFADFSILSSLTDREGITEIAPDIAVCGECLHDLKHQPHRLYYPLINCTRCGPRFTIIRGLPYDRQRTSMQEFPMCETCSGEYHDIADRRFHAQPVACNHCGPRYVLHTPEKDFLQMEDILREVNLLLSRGEIIAVKGTGGYHLVCDALNNTAVAELRIRKGRDQKPFAVMFRDLNAVREYCDLNDQEEKLITSWRRPIVLLQKRKPLAGAVSNGLGTIGAILPYMPLHVLFFSHLKTEALILTSGNLQDDPVITDDNEAIRLLQPVTSLFLSYNREIVNRADDSVVKAVRGKVCLIRRSRGYVPEPVDLDASADGILAFGAEQKNSFCIGLGNQAFMSQHIGDLRGWETYSFYTGAMEKFMKLFRFAPGWLVCDSHPEYLSSRYAVQLSEEMKLPLFKVQHHHAHVAACMAEHHLDGEVIGISLDGTGWGDDGNIWGGEFLIAKRASCERYAHFDYIPMPGGDKAVEEPWRMAFSYLYHYPETRKWICKIPVFRNRGDHMLHLVGEMIDKKVNSPLTSGAGRLFDAVAAILGLCHTATFDAEPPMRLESIAAKNINDGYPYSISPVISFAPVLDALVRDLLAGTDTGIISARFHHTVAGMITGMSEKIRKDRKLSRVVLSGGVFQNSYLLGKTVTLLEAMDFRVYFNHQVPLNDGGIALGQLIIASEREKLCV